MNQYKFLFSMLLLLAFGMSSNATGTLPYSQRMAQSQMARSGAPTVWDYPTGLFVESVLKVYDQYGGDNYYNYALNFAITTVNASGKIGTKYKFTDYTLDNINPGMFLMDVYKITVNKEDFKWKNFTLPIINSPQKLLTCSPGCRRSKRLP